MQILFSYLKAVIWQPASILGTLIFIIGLLVDGLGILSFAGIHSIELISLHTWLIILFAAFVIANYSAWAKLYEQPDRPRIVLDLDLRTFNVCYLIIKNVGTIDARNIKIQFQPNVKLKIAKSFINTKLKHIEYLSSENPLRFYFASFLDKRMLKKFTISIEYSNAQSGKRYRDGQVIDLRQFIGVSPERLPFEDVVQELGNLTKATRELVKSHQAEVKTLKHGLIIRNLAVPKLSLSVKMQLTLKLLEGRKSENQNDTWLNPFVYDFQHLLLSIRNDLLGQLIEGDELLDAINTVLLELSRYRPSEEHWEQLEVGIKKFLDKQNRQDRGSRKR